MRSGDFGEVVRVKKQRVLSEDEKYYLLKNHFVPAQNYKFPSIRHGTQMRSFQHKWLTLYNGLVYSEMDEGGYCLFCVLFGRPPVSGMVSVLTTHPLTNFQKASEKLREHFSGIGNSAARKYHLDVMQEAENFKSLVEGKHLTIDQMLSQTHSQVVALNKQKIKSIVQTIIFCGRQGLALRGHRDDFKVVQQFPSASHGNILMHCYNLE